MEKQRGEVSECSSVIAHCHIYYIQCVTKGVTLEVVGRIGCDELVKTQAKLPHIGTILALSKCMPSNIIRL